MTAETSNLPLRPSTQDADEAFFAGIDAQRARILRRRIWWYCNIAMFVLALGVASNIWSYASAASKPAATSAVILLCSNLAIIALYASGLVYVVRARPDRKRLVLVITILTAAALAIAMPFEILADSTREIVWMPGATGEQARADTGFKSVNAFGLIYGLACILVPMRIRETARLVGACAIAFAGALVMLNAPQDRALELTGFFAGYSLAGMLWSGWRYRVFDMHFRAENLRARYNDLSGQVDEISAELSQARRFHEALFPPEMPDGPVRVMYRYEPMREIGGDFLYIHRERSHATTVVLLDVSGHGIAAALAVNRLHGELQRFFAEYPEAQRELGRPGHLIAGLNAYACAALAPQGVYATAIAMRIAPPRDSHLADGSEPGTLEWASAGHPTAFVRSGERIVELVSTATMLGVIPPDGFTADARTIPIGGGDLVLAYTDGAMEARNRAGVEFSAARIRSFIEAVDLGTEIRSGRRGSTIAAQVLDAVVRHRGGRPDDDTLVIEVRAGTIAPSTRTLRVGAAVVGRAGVGS